MAKDNVHFDHLKFRSNSCGCYWIIFGGFYPEQSFFSLPPARSLLPVLSRIQGIHRPNRPQMLIPAHIVRFTLDHFAYFNLHYGSSHFHTDVAGHSIGRRYAQFYFIRPRWGCERHSVSSYWFWSDWVGGDPKLFGSEYPTEHDIGNDTVWDEYRESIGWIRSVDVEPDSSRDAHEDCNPISDPDVN